MAGCTALLVLLTTLIITTHTGRVNVAFQQKALTSSSYVGGWPPGNAVDGDTDIDGEQSTCFFAYFSPSDWTVDLGRDHQLYHITVYMGRGKEHRTANSSIILDKDPTRVCYKFPSSITDNPTRLTCNSTARFLTIKNPGGDRKQDALYLCEVEIYACKGGTHGLSCDQVCHCERCDRWTGVCAGDCSPGWQGNRCDSACSSDTYGINCQSQCSTRNCASIAASCDRFTGSCEGWCLPGLQGEDCSIPCDTAYYGRNCSRKCSERNCLGETSCDHVTGSCDLGCEEGWTGTTCREECLEGRYSYNCNMSCGDRKCVDNTVSCDRVNGSCDTFCLPGWQGDDCTQDCDSDVYGANCSQSCADRHCYGNTSCEHVTGLCEDGCEAGWTGTNCLEECGNGTYGMNCNMSCDDRKCADNTLSCDLVTGSCDTFCLPGYQGVDCTQECDFDTYGTNCSEICSDRNCYGNSSCDHVTGLCESGCEKGWIGDVCKEGCSNDTYGFNCNSSCLDRKCLEDGGSCDRFNGSCDAGCLPGWSREDCIEICPNGSYGENCSNICEERHCSDDSSCGHVTGSCDTGCSTGWMGEDCRDECSSDTYGHNCSLLCADRKCSDSAASCDRFTGSCDAGCRPGWKGKDCTRECDNQSYGIFCAKSCEQRNCLDESSCNHVTGTCDHGCKTGWSDSDCHIPCQDGTYGRNCNMSCSSRKCSKMPASCDRFTGSCDLYCLPGWMGVDCSQICDDYSYGINCVNRCAERNCIEETTCNHVTGSCDHGCVDGWLGDDCTHVCDMFLYGTNCTRLCSERRCLDNSSCLHTTGLCVGGCQSGWAGLDCTECDSNHYGANCTQLCGFRHCAVTSPCGRSGICETGCQTGWTGSDCTECAPGHYRGDCSGVCSERHCAGNSSCNETGHCDQSCAEGWTMTDCSRAIGGPESSRAWILTSIPLLAGCAAGAACVLVLLLICVILTVRKRREKTEMKSYHSSIEEIENKGYVATIPDSGEKEGLEMQFETPIDLDQQSPPLAHQELTGQTEGDGVDTTSLPGRSGWGEEERGDGYTTKQSGSGQRLDGDDDNGEGEGLVDEAPEEEEDSNSHVIPVSQLETRVREMKQNPDVAMEEFKHIPDQHPLECAESTSGDQFQLEVSGTGPYQQNRVVLYHDDGSVRRDYINANYVNGYLCEKRYILSQYPQSSDLRCDFWHMLWQESSHIVVMVTTQPEEGETTNPCYLPENVSETFNDITVCVDHVTQLAHYTITALSIQREKDTKKRHVTHFQLFESVQSETSVLLSAMWRVKQTSGFSHSPIVHCSPDTDRSGVFIAVESLLKQATTDGVVDVISFISAMRAHSRGIIGHVEHYEFILRALSEAVTKGDTSLDADVITHIDTTHIDDVIMGNNSVEVHLEHFRSMDFDDVTHENQTTVPSYTSRDGFRIFSPSCDVEDVLKHVVETGSCCLVTWTAGGTSWVPSSEVLSKSQLSVCRQSSLPLSESVQHNVFQLQIKEDDHTIRVDHYAVTGSVVDPSTSVLIDCLIQGRSLRTPTVLLSRETRESRLLVLQVDMASRLQDDGRVDIISDMQRLLQATGAPPFTPDDVISCVQFAQRRLEMLGMYASL